MVDNIDTINNNIDNIDDYDFLNLSYNQLSSLKFGEKLGGKRGITFESDPEKFNKLNKQLQSEPSLKKHKIINENPLKIKINEKNKQHFDFTICLDLIECLNGIGETREMLHNALRLTNKFIFISQPNYDSDVNLFKNGFKTYYSDWSRHTNHLTSNLYFNLLFDFYKKGFIEDYMIFYTTPIKNSTDPIIHPLNSPKNQPNFNDDKHPTKNERVKFKNIYRNLNVIITIHGCKDIDEIYKSINGEKSIIYDSRQGIFNNLTETFIDKQRDDHKGIIGKMNEFLNSDA
ncbi:MAG: hypothetical protein BZ135_00170 [Methanosphaera sp. rholeuAM6]|nr:MAG: hypothetical protein BZ135_00170 [Methanosphaera sp. rholeuAM6]